MRRLWGVVLLLAPIVAHAQTPAPQERTFSPQIWHPAPGPDEFISVEPAKPLAHKGWAVGLYINYARNLLSILNYDTQRMTAGSTRANIVGNLIGGDIYAAVGVIDRLQFGLAIPMTLWQNGDNFHDANCDTVTSACVRGASGFAFGDPRIHIKARLYGKDSGGVQISLSHWLGIPLATDYGTDGKAGEFGGEKRYTGFSGEPRVLVGWEAERWRVGAFIGVLWRANVSKFFSTVSGQQLTYGGAFAYDVIKSRLTLVAEIFGHSNSFDAVAVASGQQNSITDQNDAPLELDVAAKIKVVTNLTVNIGIGNGIIAGVGSPQPRAFVGAVYAPDTRDEDHDGVPDNVDKCLGKPEDRDGFQDSDGCPDPDNDGDTILDKDDKCPNQAEDFDQFEDEDGCPDPDNDKDGIDDLHDACPMDPEDHKPPKPNDGCPQSKTDTDGDGIKDDKDKCPNDPEDVDGFQDEDGCPDPDNDGDGIPDNFDQCPNEPEDMDGFQDDDGCPDPDNDKDGIPDKEDKCPNEPETINGYQDEDGCPDKGPPSKVKIEKGQIVILEKIFFDKDKSTIKPVSFGLLDQVALVIKGHSEFKIRIEGHTDSQGKADHNLKLSQERADSVRTYLIKKMIDPNRLISVGYGPSVPIADNKTAAGREANRRVEFHIMEEEKKKPADKPEGEGGEKKPADPAEKSDL